MARGSADFDGSALRLLRNNKRVDGRLLSAAELAARVGTSKARILAYEHRRSTPEPERIVQLAAVFKVPPAQLSFSGAGEQSIRELRCQAGLTAAQAAAHAGISRGTYRNIELLAQLPVRDDGMVRIRLCDAFGIQLSQFHRALRRHPLAIARRTHITDALATLFQRAYHTHIPAVVEADDESLVRIAGLLQRAPSVVCRLVNAELARYRRLLKDQALADVDAAYAQDLRAVSQARERNRQAVGLIETGPSRSAHILINFIAQAVTCRQWRFLVALADAGTDGLATEDHTHLAGHTDIWALTRQHFLHGTQRAGRSRICLTLRGIRMMRSQHELYACLYPRAGTPTLAGYWTAAARRPQDTAPPPDTLPKRPRPTPRPAPPELHYPSVKILTDTPDTPRERP